MQNQLFSQSKESLEVYAWVRGMEVRAASLEIDCHSKISVHGLIHSPDATWVSRERRAFVKLG